jgi:hypothetical protein
MVFDWNLGNKIHRGLNTLRLCGFPFVEIEVVSHSLGGSATNWHYTKPTHWVPQEPHKLSEGSSITCSTRVALHDSRGVSTIPLTISSLEHRTLFFACSDGDHNQAISKVATSKSNKHHRLATRLPSATQCTLTMQSH